MRKVSKRKTPTGRRQLPFSEVRKLIGEERSFEAWFGAFNLRLGSLLIIKIKEVLRRLGVCIWSSEERSGLET